MTTPSGGFTADLNELEHGAKVILPDAAQLLRDPIVDLRDHRDLARTGLIAELHSVQLASWSFMEAIAARQARVCDIITSTAETLAEIVDLYRRADGQG